MENLEIELKKIIIDTLNLEDISPQDIDTHAPLFGDGLGLDSIDALELGLAIKKKYGISLSAENEEIRQHFFSIASLAQFISANKNL